MEYGDYSPRLGEVYYAASLVGLHALLSLVGSCVVGPAPRELPTGVSGLGPGSRGGDGTLRLLVRHGTPESALGCGGGATCGSPTHIVRFRVRWATFLRVF